MSPAITRLSPTRSGICGSQQTTHNHGCASNKKKSVRSKQTWIWLVVYLPLWKIWVRQLGVWNSQHMEKKHVPKHQPVMVKFNCHGGLIHHLSTVDWSQTTNQWIHRQFPSSDCPFGNAATSPEYGIFSSWVSLLSRRLQTYPLVNVYITMENHHFS